MRRLLSPLRYVEGGEWRFTFTADLVVNLNKGFKGFHILMTGGKVWAMLDDDILTIFAGYSFDGCSPAWRLFGKWYGTPTPHSAVAAAGVHDCLRQFLGLACLSYTRKDTDDIFHDMLADEGFGFGDIYHGAVAGGLGTLYLHLTASRPRHIGCHCHA